jgi:hypothetical protein
VERNRKGKTPDSSTRALWKSYQHSNLVAKEEELANKLIHLPSELSSFILWRDFEHSLKSHDMGPTPLLSLRKECLGFLSPLKIHRPRLGLNPLNLVPIARTLTIPPPKTTLVEPRGVCRPTYLPHDWPTRKAFSIAVWSYCWCPRPNLRVLRYVIFTLLWTHKMIYTYNR